MLAMRFNCEYPRIADRRWRKTEIFIGIERRCAGHVGVGQLCAVLVQDISERARHLSGILPSRRFHRMPAMMRRSADDVASRSRIEAMMTMDEVARPDAAMAALSPAIFWSKRLRMAFSTSSGDVVLSKKYVSGKRQPSDRIALDIKVEVAKPGISLPRTVEI